jgi:cytochrome c556
MQRKLTGMIVGVVVALGASYPVIADTTPEDAKDYRAAIMTTLRGHIGASSMIARGLVDNNGQLLAHAEGLANGAAELKNIFPEGSAVDGSEALPAIWGEPDKFAEAIEAMVVAAAAFEDAAAGGDPAAIGSAFRNVGMSCRGCHDNFRKSDD